MKYLKSSLIVTLVVSVFIAIGVFAQPWYLIHLDLERIKSGNLYPVVWNIFDEGALVYQSAEVTDEQVIMYPLTTFSNKRLVKRIEALEQQGFLLRDNPAVHLRYDIEWGQNENNDQNWHFKLNAWDMLVPYFQLYERTQDPLLLERASEIMLGWVDFNLINNKPNRFKWHDMATGLRAVQLAVFIQSKFFKTLPVQAKEKLIYAADMHIKVLSREELLSEGNHGLFQLVGLASLCRAISLHSCHSDSEFAERQFAHQVASQFSEEGIHLEHSSQYHIWAVKVLERIQKLNLFDESNFERLTLARKNAKWFYHPDGELSLLGDSERKSVSEASDVSPELLFLTGNDLGKEPKQHTAIFPSTGFAFFRSAWRGNERDKTSYLAVAGGFHSRVHKQRDDMTFEWSEWGTRIISDSGKFSYDNDDVSQYFRSRKAHNTLTVDDESSWISFPQPYGSAIQNGGVEKGVFWIDMRHVRDEYDVAHRRVLLLSPQKWLMVVDDIHSDKKRKYNQWFHFDPAAQLLESTQGIVLSLAESNRRIDIGHWTSNESETASFYGKEGEQMSGWISEAYRQRAPRYSLTYSTKAQSATMVTLFSLDGKVENIYAQSESGMLVVCWQTKGTGNGIAMSNTPMFAPSKCDDE